MHIASVLSRFYRLSPFVKPYVRRIGFVFLLSSFGTVLGLLWPLFTKILIDDVLLARNLSLLVTLCGIMLGVTLLGYGVGAVNRYLYTQVTARVLFALRQHLFAHLQKLSLRFHTQVKVGDLLSRLNTDIAEIQSRPHRRGLHLCHQYLRPAGHRGISHLAQLAALSGQPVRYPAPNIWGTQNPAVYGRGNPQGARVERLDFRLSGRVPVGHQIRQTVWCGAHSVGAFGPIGSTLCCAGDAV